LDLSSSNRDKTLNAPLNVILAYDTRFFEHLPALTVSPNARIVRKQSVAHQRRYCAMASVRPRAHL